MVGMSTPTSQPVKLNESRGGLVLLADFNAVQMAHQHEHGSTGGGVTNARLPTTCEVERGRRRAEAERSLGRGREAGTDEWPTGHVERGRGRGPP